MNCQKLIIICGYGVNLQSNLPDPLARFAGELADAFHESNTTVDPIIKCFYPERSGHEKYIKEHLDIYLNFKNLIVVTHNEYVFVYLRRLIAEGKIDYQNVEIYWVDDYGSTKLTINQYGVLNSWPKGMFDSVLTESAKILTITAEIIKKNKL